jgi:hypothetical protein
LSHSKVAARSVVEGLPKRALIGRLVGRAVVADHHAVRVATPHVGLRVVGADPVLHAADVDFGNQPPARDLVGNPMPTGLIRIANRQLLDLLD